MRKNINFKGVEYDCLIEGNGKPCLIIGLASVPMHGLSDELKKHYCFMASDLYWGSEVNHLDLSTVTLESLADDIDELRISLGLDKIAILAHSGFGLLAFEYALKYPDNVTEIIAIASPSYWNAGVLEDDRYYAENASDQRKAKFEQDQSDFAKLNIDQMSASEKWIAAYNASNAKYWYDFNQDNSKIWSDVTINVALFDHFFGTLLSSYDKRQQYNQIQTEVFLAIGKHDYVVSPTMWDTSTKERFKRMHYFEFSRSGHYPMIEEADLFNKRLLTANYQI